MEVPMNPLQARLITSSHSAHDVPMCVGEPRGWLRIHYWPTGAASVIQVMSG